MNLDQLLIQYGINISSNFIYDVVKTFIKNRPNSSKNDLSQEVANHLKIQNAEILSEKIVKLLADTGYIKIEGSKIYGNEVLLQGNFFFGSDSISQTKSGSTISAGAGASISGRGKVHQDEEGNITISAE